MKIARIKDYVAANNYSIPTLSRRVPPPFPKKQIPFTALATGTGFCKRNKKKSSNACGSVCTSTSFNLLLVKQDKALALNPPITSPQKGGKTLQKQLSSMGILPFVSWEINPIAGVAPVLLTVPRPFFFDSSSTGSFVSVILFAQFYCYFLHHCLFFNLVGVGWH